MLDIRRLKYFHTIVRQGSMAGASRELNVAQPALSHHMSELERVMGLALLERLPRGVRPTPAGNILMEHARIILDNVAKAERELRDYAVGGSRSTAVRLGLLPSWLAGFGGTISQLLATRLPDRVVQILEVRTDEAERLVGRGELDIATALESSGSEFLDPILQETLWLASKDPLPTSVRFADLSGMNLVLASSAHRFRRDIERVAAEHGVSLKVVLEIDGYFTLKRAVEQGIGNTVLSWNAIRAECEEGKLHAAAISDCPFRRPVYLRRAAGVDMQLAWKFFEILRAASLHAERPDNVP